MNQKQRKAKLKKAQYHSKNQPAITALKQILNGTSKRRSAFVSQWDMPS